MRPFTRIAALVMLVVAAAHIYRIFAGLNVEIGAWPVPMWVSWIAAGGAAILGGMLFVESGRRG
jgi:hypothetical protein